MIETLPVTAAVAATRETVAVAVPPGPVAVTEAVEEAGIVDGAVNRPVELTLPTVAVQPVAPAEENCTACPSFTDTAVGEIVCAVIPETRESVAVAVPPGPVAVTEAVEEAGIVDGAV